jgi:hypothetical protein
MGPMTRAPIRAGALAALLLSALLSGCYQATFVRNVPPAGPPQDRWTSFFVFGTVGVEHIDLRALCPGGSVRMIATGGNLATQLVAIITVGIYTPRKFYWQCGAPGAPAHAAATLSQPANMVARP